MLKGVIYCTDYYTNPEVKLCPSQIVDRIANARHYSERPRSSIVKYAMKWSLGVAQRRTCRMILGIIEP